MFATSTQLKHWMFENEEAINERRIHANKYYVESVGERERDNEALLNILLAPAEERLVVKQYEYHLRDFCRKFNPPMPKSVIGTSFHYFKRFYLDNSVMKYHPKEILVTCVYLACKTEEFNVSINHFTANIKGDRQKAESIILNTELLLMEQLKYHLTVHNPYRAVEGLLIDIKTRCQSIGDPEELRPFIDDFLDKIFLTDASLVYSPSQIALAGILYAASRKHQNLDLYVTETLLGKYRTAHLSKLIETVKAIRFMVKNIEMPPKDQVKVIEKQLEKIQKLDTQSESQLLQKRAKELLDEDFLGENYAQIAEERKREEHLLRRNLAESP